MPAYDYIPNNYGYIAPEVIVEKPIVIQQPIKEVKEEYNYNDSDDSVKIINVNQNKKDKKKKNKKTCGDNKMLWAIIFLLIIINLFFIVKMTLKL